MKLKIRNEPLYNLKQKKSQEKNKHKDFMKFQITW